MKKVTVVAGLVLFVVGCHDYPGLPADEPDDASPQDCTDGELIACMCEDGTSGFAICEDGSPGECDCDIDGEFPMFCGMCHGDWDYPAPPVDTKGNSDTSDVTVGAHRQHLAVSDWHRKVECSDCHAVPVGIETPGHVDESPAELTFSSVSIADGAEPAFDRDSAVCADSYCHGATMASGGSNTAPVWTGVGQAQAACGSCHGLPPGGSHPTSDKCADCHGNVVDEGLAFTNSSLHIDGKVDFSGEGMSCISCHGSDDNPAPPVDTSGNTDPIIATVGAHQSHLGTSDWHREVQCSDCHDVPESLDDCHNDGAPAEHSWSALSNADGADSSYDFGTATCSNTYCHGATLEAGGTNPDPQWNVVASGEVVCGDCHGIPPCSGHPGSGPCAPCHDQVYDGTDWVNPQLHIDGLVQVTDDLPCGACHGMPPAAPHTDNADCGLCHGMVWDDGDWVDEDLHDNGTVDVTSLACSTCHGNPPTPGNQDYAGGGGAHDRHVAQLGMACSTCHGHDGSGADHAQAATVIQANVDIAFQAAFTYPGGTSMNNGGTPAFDHNGGNPTCSVGCHNPIVDDSADLANSASWTDTTIACSECHERPGLATPINHDIGGTDAVIRTNCSTCHDTSAHSSGVLALADPDTSDGIDPTGSGAQVADLCKTCHDGGAATFFGGASPDDVSVAWTGPRAHDDNGASCTTCHGYHGGDPGDDLVATVEETGCAGSGCHDDVVNEMGLAGGFSRHHVVDSEQSAGLLECVTCHAPHVVDDSPWQPVTDPDTGALVAAADVPGDHFTTSDGNTNAFCLDCHDGSWADAIDIENEVDTEDVFSGSSFIRTSGGSPDSNLHYSHINGHGFACTHCHNVHSNTGTAGVNRGRLLYNYMTIMNASYPGKGSCQLAGGPTGCHH